MVASVCRPTACRGIAVEVERAHQLVDPQRLGAEELAQPPLHGAAQQRHLPQPVLGMHVAEAEKGVVVGLRQDVRHRVAVAHDLDLLLGPVERQRSGHNREAIVRRDSTPGRRPPAHERGQREEQPASATGTETPCEPGPFAVALTPPG